MPLDGVAEAILLGLTAPILLWLEPSYLRHRGVRALIVIVLVAKAASMLVVQDGWCVQFETPKPLVTDSRGRIHSWDVRTDWQSRTPQCSAILTRSYGEYKGSRCGSSTCRRPTATCRRRTTARLMPRST